MIRRPPRWLLVLVVVVIGEIIAGVSFGLWVADLIRQAFGE